MEDNSKKTLDVIGKYSKDIGYVIDGHKKTGNERGLRDEDTENKNNIRWFLVFLALLTISFSSSVKLSSISFKKFACADAFTYFILSRCNLCGFTLLFFTSFSLIKRNISITDGKVDMKKASNIILNDFREGKIR